MIQLSRYPGGEINYLISICKGSGEWSDDINNALIFDNLGVGKAVADSLGTYFTYGSTITLIKLIPSTSISQKMADIVDDIADM